MRAFRQKLTIASQTQSPLHPGPTSSGFHVRSHDTGHLSLLSRETLLRLFLSHGPEGVCLSSFLGLSTLTTGFPDNLEDIVLGEDANDRLNQHSACEDAQGGHQAELEACQLLPLRIRQILYHLADPGKSAEAGYASLLAANMLAEWQPAGIVSLALRSSSPMTASRYLSPYQYVPDQGQTPNALAW
jgi:hypothetical protein